MTVRISYATGDGPFPLIIFSQGALCPKHMYVRLTDHWASHGYVTISPVHIDSESVGLKFQDLSDKDLALSRVEDMRYILDHLDDIEVVVPGLKGKLNHTLVASAGHSFGGQIAMALAGLSLRKETTGEVVNTGDPRIKASVVLGGVGKLPNVPGRAWDNLKLPLYAAGGTLDLGRTGQGPAHPWRWRMGGYDNSPTGDKYGVVLENADHYYGGLICRENAGETNADFEGLTIIRGTSTAFLDAYLKGDSEARVFLNEIDLGDLTNGRATLERK